jgi:predicted metal-dependent phosphoesterase TrpH
MIRVDLHLHTSASFDCDVAPERMVDHGRRLGISPVALTDHDTVRAALKLQTRYPGRVIVGQEVATRRGELIGLFLNRQVPKHLEPGDAIREIKDQGGLVYLEHPYDTGRRCLDEESIERLANQIDIVEVFNGRSTEEANRKAEDLCAIIGAAAGAGSDAHTLGEIGSVCIEMEPFSTAEDFLAKLRLGTIVRRPNRLRMRLNAALTGRAPES